MKKQLCVISFALLFFAMLANAAPINVLLNSPTDKAVITEYTQSFIFSFDQDPKEIILNCSLIINNEAKGFRNSLIVMNNNKISLSLDQGQYSWGITCLDKNFNVISSGTRTFTVDVSSSATGGYETIYNNDGSRSYVITIAPGQASVTLPVLKVQDDIDIKMGGKTYYINVLTMGIDINKDFVRIWDRTSGKRYDMLVPSTLKFDFNNDQTIDIALLLNNVERGVNAYFTVTPYPGTAPAPPETPPQTQPVETPTPPVVQPETPPAETPPTQSSSEGIPAQTTQPPITGPESTSEPERGETSSTWYIPAIVAVLIVIILITVLSNVKGKKSGKKTPEKDAKREAKKEMPEPEQQPVPQEKFDIIKSTGKRK